MKKIAMLGLALAVSSTGAMAGDWGDWQLYSRATPMSPVSVYYKTKVNSDEIRVAWRCVNEGGETHSCSVGAGNNKVYECFSGYSNVGTTEALGERATIAAGDEYEFISEPACQGLGADSLNATVQVSIED